MCRTMHLFTARHSGASSVSAESYSCHHSPRGTRCRGSFEGLNEIMSRKHWTQRETLRRRFSVGAHRSWRWGESRCFHRGRREGVGDGGGGERKRHGGPAHCLGVLARCKRQTVCPSQQLEDCFPAPVTSRLKQLDGSHLGLVWVC